QVEQVMTEIKSTQVWSVFRDMSLRRSGLVKGRRYKDMIEKHVGKVKIENLDRQFAALAVDFKSGKRIVLDSGNLAAAIHASTAVPFIFEPVKFKNKQLIDGAVKTPVPVLLAKNMGADVVIAVNLYKNIFPLNSERYNPLQVALRTTQLFLYQLAKQNCAQADITIWPEIVEPKKYSIFGNIVGNKKVTKVGEAAARKQIRKIKKLIKKAEKSV
ncbi:MAG: hypothetical protein HN846_01295, partial [Candidatus Pacebacteria bacterium]|nr:hypothetical protein [Candidatus Paceibacterota bacterium]